MSTAETPRTTPINWNAYLPLGIIVGTLMVLIWGYWNDMARTAHFWENPKYSHGYLIPLIATFLLWLRRSESIRVPDNLTYIGAAMIGAGLVVCWTVQQSTFAGDGVKISSEMIGLISLGQFIGVGVAIAGAALLLGQLPTGEVTNSARWAGVGLVVFGLAIRLLATYFPNISVELSSFVPCVIGIFLIVGGWPTLKWAGPPLAFLIFMFPLPSFLDVGLLNPLQRLATVCSRFALETLGIACFAEGNNIIMGEANIGVAEQCSGLRMLTMFVAISVAFGMISNRPMWERIFIVFSAIPIALFVNITRITVTGILYYIAADPNNALGITEDLAHTVFHDYAGWVMMPVALGIMYVEYQILSHLIVEDLPASGGPASFDFRRPRRGPMLTK